MLLFTLFSSTDGLLVAFQSLTFQAVLLVDIFFVHVSKHIYAYLLQGIYLGVEFQGYRVSTFLALLGNAKSLSMGCADYIPTEVQKSLGCSLISSKLCISRCFD